VTGAETRQAPVSLAAALAELQTRLPHIGKDKTARVTSQRTGKTHTYDYVNLAAVSEKILPLLGGLGLSFVCRPTLDEGRFVLAYEMRHVSDDVGIGGQYPLPASGTPQEIGSAITYARRYCLCAITGVAPDDDDDDGQAAEDAARQPAARQPRSRKPPAGQPGQPLTGQALKDHKALEPAHESHATGKVTRLTETPADDPWLTVDQNGERRPPGQAPAAIGEQAARSGQRGLIHSHFKRLGFEAHERDERLAITALLAGTPGVESTNDLSEKQVAMVVERLSRCKDRPSLMERVGAAHGGQQEPGDA